MVRSWLSWRTVLFIVMPTLLAVVGGAAFYLLTIQAERQSRLNASYLRDMAVLAEQFEGVVAGKGRSVSNGAGQQKDGSEDAFGQTISRLGLTVLHPPDAKNAANVQCKNTTLASGVVWVCISADRDAEQTRPMTDSTVTTFGWPARKRLSAIGFCVYEAPDKCGQLGIGALLDPLVDSSSFRNEEVFFAIGDQVMYHRGERTLRLARPPAPRPSPPSSPGDKSTAPAADQEGQSVATDFDIGGRHFKLVSQPLLFRSVDGKDHDAPWVLGALIAKEHFDAQVSAPSWTWAGYSMLLIVLLALAVPTLKVATIGKSDPLEARDVRLLAASLLLLAGGATATLYWTWASRSLDAALDTELASVATQLRGNLLREVRQVAGAIDLYANEWVEPQLNPGPSPPLEAGTTDDAAAPGSTHARTVANLFADNARVDGKSCDLTNCPSPEWQQRLEDLYPYIAVASWADETEPEAMQKEKWSITKFPAPAISARDRPWFVDAVGDRVWRLPAADDLPPQNVAVHMVNSITLGGVMPTLSKHYRDDVGHSFVANIVPHLISMTHPVLPAGFTFAVIQADGRVVFHSSPARRLYENFFAESTFEQDVRAAIEATQERWLSGEYHGERQRALVMPIFHSPWTLLVMRDQGAQQRQRLDVLVTWIIEFSVYVVLLAALYMLWRWRSGPALRDWLWPKSDKPGVYRQAVLTLVIGVMAGLVVFQLPSVPPFGALALVAVVAVTFAAIALAWIVGSDANSTLHPQLSRALWLLVFAAILVEVTFGNLFVCCVATFLAVVAARHAWAALRRSDSAVWQADFLALWFLLILLTAVLPSALFLQDSWDMGMEIFVRNGQLRLDEDLRNLADRNREEYSNPGAGISDELLDLRQEGWIGWPQGRPCLDSAEVVTTGIFGDVMPCYEPEGSDERCVEPIVDGEQFGFVNGILAWARSRPAATIMSQLPIREEDAISTRALVKATGADERWSWRRIGDHGADNAELCSYRSCYEHAAEWSHGPFDKTRERKRSRIRSTTPFPALQTLATIPPFTTLQTAASWSRAAIVLCALLVAHFSLGLLRFLARQVVGLEERRPPSADPATTAEYACGLLIVQPDMPATAGAGVRVVDLATATAGTPPTPDDKNPGIADTRAWVVRSLDVSLSDFERSNEALLLLEAALSRPTGALIVQSAVGPLTYLLDPTSRKSAANGETPETVARWARVLERLSLLPRRVARALSGAQLVAWAEMIADARRKDSPPPPGDVEWPRHRVDELWRECDWTPRLRGIAFEMLAQGSSDEDVATRLEYTAASHYYVLWSQLSRDEQALLVQLAQGAYVNPRSWRTARSLVHHGLVRFDGAPRLMNESFRRFVADIGVNATAADVTAPSQWDRIRDPLYYLLIAGGLVVYFTQPEGWTRLVGFLSAIGSVMTKFTEASGLFGRLKPGAPAK